MIGQATGISSFQVAGIQPEPRRSGWHFSFSGLRNVRGTLVARTLVISIWGRPKPLCLSQSRSCSGSRTDSSDGTISRSHASDPIPVAVGYAWDEAGRYERYGCIWTGNTCHLCPETAV